MLPLILASTSPARKQLLESLGLPYSVSAPHVDEARQPGEPVTAMVTRLAEAKARAVAAEQSAALIIGADQVAALGDDILGKPGNHAQAVHQLQRVSGKHITFYTGLCLLNSATGTVQVDIVPSTVVFRSLDATQIENYLEREQPYQCACSFRSEGAGAALIERLIGDDPSALIGLSLIRLTRMLEQEGVRLI
ncbi:MAG: Maf family protein [Gammaproteobacteria bacterium]|nr:Maf family protein [Gammaproteobacteria bacterium]